MPQLRDNLKDANNNRAFLSFMKCDRKETISF